ncbi:MAG: YodL domain-containing protein [Clostridiaceae bacterium]|nr:YodL domain-containing protein [Clostridiaceae bacterium]
MVDGNVGKNHTRQNEKSGKKHSNDASLSVSDVIVLHQNGQDQAFFVDSFGFKQVPGFFADSPEACERQDNR